jgi:hypothetical protein
LPFRVPSFAGHVLFACADSREPSTSGRPPAPPPPPPPPRVPPASLVLTKAGPVLTSAAGAGGGGSAAAGGGAGAEGGGGGVVKRPREEEGAAVATADAARGEEAGGGGAARTPAPGGVGGRGVPRSVSKRAQRLAGGSGRVRGGGGGGGGGAGEGGGAGGGGGGGGGGLGSAVATARSVTYADMGGIEPVSFFPFASFRKERYSDRPYCPDCASDTRAACTPGGARNHAVCGPRARVHRVHHSIHPPVRAGPSRHPRAGRVPAAVP